MNRRVLVVTLKYPPVYSGYGNQISSVMKEVLSITDSISFTVLTTNNCNTTQNNQPRVINLGISIKNQLLSSVFFGVHVFFWAIFHKNTFDSIHCISAHGHTAIPCIYAGKLLKKSTYIKVTQAEFRKTIKKLSWIHRLIRNFRIRLTSKADYYIAISKQIESDLQAVGINQEQIVKIPNGVNTKTYTKRNVNDSSNVRKRFGLDNNTIILLYAGALNRRKGTYDLLEATRRLSKKSLRDFTLVLCGPDHENIIETIVNNNTEYSFVKYLGKVDNMSEIYKASDVFVLPSYSEGLPNVLLEATVSGVASIGSQIGGVTDILKSTSLLFHPGDIEKMETLLDRLISDDKYRQYISDTCYTESSKEFSLESVARSYIKFYQSI